MRTVAVLTGCLIVAALFCGCENLNDYSTKPGTCYAGNIIDADFVRSGAFEAKVKITMSLDVDALSSGADNGAVITTDDGLFVNAPVKQMIEMTRDSLSLLDFPGGRVRSFLAFAPDTAGNVAEVVVSLMENGDVETRIFRPSLVPEDALFGVFRLEKNEFCNGPVAPPLPDAGVPENATD